MTYSVYRDYGYGQLNFRDVPHCLEQVEEETSVTKYKNIYIIIKILNSNKAFKAF